MIAQIAGAVEQVAKLVIDASDKSPEELKEDKRREHALRCKMFINALEANDVARVSTLLDGVSVSESSDSESRNRLVSQMVGFNLWALYRLFCAASRNKMKEDLL